MGFGSELRGLFSGKWRKVFIGIALVIALRFATQEWQDENIAVRLLYGCYILAAQVAVGFIWMVVMYLRRRFSKSHTHDKDMLVKAAVRDLKRGFLWAVVFTFFLGVIMVDDFLGVLEKVWDFVVDKISSLLG